MLQASAATASFVSKMCAADYCQGLAADAKTTMVAYCTADWFLCGTEHVD